MAKKKSSYDRMRNHTPAAKNVPVEGEIRLEDLTDSEKEMYYEMLKGSMGILHRNMPLGTARSRKAYFASVIKDSHYLATIYVAMYREIQEEGGIDIESASTAAGGSDS